MKNKLLILLCVLTVVAVGTLWLVSCKKQEESVFKIVKMTGGSLYTNISNKNLFGSGDDSEITNYKDSIHAEIMEDGDILYILIEDSDFFYHYSIEDGEFLAFSKDNANLFVNDNLKSLSVDDEDIKTDRFIADNEEILKNIQSIIIPDSITRQSFTYLKRIAALNPSAGLILGEYSEEDESVIGLFDPQWIVCDELNFSLPVLENLKQIFITEGKRDDFYQLINPINLEKIIIYWDELFEVGDVPLYTKVKSLTISDMNDYDTVGNLSIVNKFPNLEELHIFNSTPFDISAVTELENLRIFNIFSDSVTTGLSALDDLTSLEWMNFPPNTTDDDLRRFIDNHPKLKIAGISNYNRIMDLQPLQSLNSLIGLNIYGDTLNLETLYGLKQLKYLGIPEEILYDSTNFVLLKAKLPETMIVPNNIGICLGTGWLLLFFPVMAFIYLVFSYFRKKV